MRIALNLLYVGAGVAGGRVYAEGLLRGLAQVDAENEYVVFTRRDTGLPELPARFQRLAAPVSDASILWRTAWEYGALPARVRRARADVFHGLGSLSPSARPCPLVLTIHDLIHRQYPNTVPVGHRLFMRIVLPIVARRADRIIVPSRATSDDVVRLLNVKEDRIRLVEYGPGSDFRRVDDSATVAAVLQKHGIRRPFLLSVCRGYAHKNLAGLLRAFAVLRRGGRDDVQMMLVGERYRSGHELDRLTEELRVREGVVFSGFIDNAELQSLYSAATVFAFPSLAEGFGLPVLEAMACGAPVVASGASAVPEAVGDAGLLADARNPEAFAAALGRVLDDSDLQEVLRRRGLARVKEYSWERCAAETLAVYRELAE